MLISCLEEYDNAKSQELTSDQAGTIAIQIPVNLPFSRTSTDFESVNDEIEINGIPYRNVKRRLHNDSIELICVPDHSAMKWNAARKTIIQVTHELQQGVRGKKNNSNTTINVKAPSEECTRNDALSAMRPVLNSLEKISKVDTKILSCFSSTPFKPPDQL